MANGFPSVGAGFSRGFATGSQLQTQRQQLRQNREAQESQAALERADRFREAWSTQQEQALSMFNDGLEMLQQAAESGATDEELQPIIAATTKPIALLASEAQGFRRSAVEAGADPQLVESFPNGLSIVRENMPRVEAAVAAGRSRFTSPEEAGEEQAREEMARFQQIADNLNVPVEQVAEAAGVTLPQQQPNVQNFLLQDGTLTSVDLAAEDGSARVAELVNSGAVRVGLNVTGQTPSDLSVTASEIQQFREAEIASTTAVNEIGRLREQLQDQDLRTSFTGGLVRGLDTLADQMVQVASSFGFDESQLLDPTQYDLSGFGPEAQSSSAFRSNLINMFYAMARAAEPGARQLSTVDIQNQADRFSASGSRGQISASLDEIERSIKEQFNIRHRVFSRTVEVGPVPEALQPTGGGVDLQALAEKGEENLTEEDLAALTPDELVELARLLGKTVVEQ